MASVNKIKGPQPREFMYIHAHTCALKQCKSMDTHLKVEKVKKIITTNCLQKNNAVIFVIAP